MKTISIINLKGGVGKTISAINIAHILATRHGKRVLLIDNDKQGNTTKFFCGGECDITDYTIAQLLTNKGANAKDVLISTGYENLQLIGADMSLIEANTQLMNDIMHRPQTRLKEALKPVSEQFDICIIDNAPDIAFNTLNALVASDYVIIPVKLDQFALDGLEILTDNISDVRENHNSGLKLLGCFITMFYYDRHRDNVKHYTNALKDLKRITDAKPFSTAIGRTAKIDESTHKRSPIIDYSCRSAASLGYIRLTEEIICRIGHHG